MEEPIPSSQTEVRKLIAAGVAIAGCIGAIVLMQLPQMRSLRIHSQTASIEEIRRDVEAEQVQLSMLQKVPSFGFQNLIADWVFLSFLQYFGDLPVRNRTDYHLSPEYFKVILSRDPFFLDAYTFLSTSTSLYAGMPDQSIAITEQGLTHLKPTVPAGSYYVWRSKAIDELLFKGDAQTAQRSFAKAAEWAAIAGDTVIADSSRQTADFLASNPDSKYAQVAAWTMVLSSAPDDRTRSMAIAQINRLGGKIVANSDGTFRVEPPAQD